MFSTIRLLTLFAAAVAFADAVKYTYDDAGRLTSAGYPNGTVITYSYDAAGNLTARTVSGGAGTSSKKPKPDAKGAAKTKRAPGAKSGSSDNKADSAKH